VGKSLKILYLMLVGMMLTHLFYVFYFYAVGSYFMSVFNVLSVVFYISLFIVFLNKKYLGVMIFLFIEVCVHAFFASVTLGLSSGFEMFIICVVFSIFHVKRITQASRKVIYVLYLFAFLTLISMRLGPYMFDLSMFSIYPEEGALTFIFIFNAVIAFVVVLLFLNIFLDDVEKDKTQLRRQNARLLELSRIDPLTGLLNRRAMKQRLEDAFYAKSNYELDYVVAIIDVDDFKRINDQFGHSCGDQVLKKIADIIRQKIRETDYACRWGGDEILILLNNSFLEGAIATITRIQQEIGATPVVYNQTNVSVTVTAGVCSSEYFYLLQDVIVEADRRLYIGKRKGKNQIVYSTSEEVSDHTTDQNDTSSMVETSYKPSVGNQKDGTSN
jgi:diguanylate cyclase (GGDEF)-like protein